MIFCGFDRAAGDRGAALVLELAVDAFDPIERRVFEAREPGAHEIVTQIREQHAEGGEHSGRGRDDHGPDPDLARDLDRVQRSGAAIGDERKVAGIEAALGGDALHRIGHRGRGDPQDSVGRRGRVHAERLRHALEQRAPGGLDVEPHFAAEEPVGTEPAEHEVRIGHRRLAAAEAIAGRARRGARALRADPQPALLHPRNRPAAGADLENVHHRDLHRQGPIVAADQRRPGGERFALVDDTGLRGGAAHVEGDRVLEAERMAERLGADDAGGGPRFQHAHAVALRLLRRRKGPRSTARSGTSRQSPRCG